MKRIIIITLAIAFTISITNLATAAGITGGTTKNTTKKQADETSGDNRQCKKSSISEEEKGKIAKEIMDVFVPGTKTLFDILEEVGEQQIKSGGILTTGSTVKDAKK